MYHINNQNLNKSDFDEYITKNNKEINVIDMDAVDTSYLEIANGWGQMVPVDTLNLKPQPGQKITDLIGRYILDHYVRVQRVIANNGLRDNELKKVAEHNFRVTGTLTQADVDAFKAGKNYQNTPISDEDLQYIDKMNHQEFNWLNQNHPISQNPGIWYQIQNVPGIFETIEEANKARQDILDKLSKDPNYMGYDFYAVGPWMTAHWSMYHDPMPPSSLDGSRGNLESWITKNIPEEHRKAFSFGTFKSIVKATVEEKIKNLIHLVHKNGTTTSDSYKIIDSNDEIKNYINDCNLL